MRGKPLQGNLVESLRQFAICEGMKWSHLPAPGGLYAQSPKFLDDCLVIWSAQGEHERQKQAKEKQEQKKQQAAQRRGSWKR